MDMKYTFRIDDISVNTNPAKLRMMVDFLRSAFKPGALRLILAVSPAVHDMAHCAEALTRERTFPSMLHTESDFTAHYHVKRLGVPDYIFEYQKQSDVVIAAHGMVHADHRLMSRGAQELSILMSCAVLGANIFVPPFHKWNHKTEAVCKAHGITIVKYDHSWRHLLYHPFDPRTKHYYVHTHDLDYHSFCAKFPTKGLGAGIPQSPDRRTGR